ncbi:MAG: tetratricopeptide repeat protein [Phycisphaerae bacterium]
MAQRAAIGAAGKWISRTQLVVTAVFVLALSWFELSSVDLGYHLAYGRVFWSTGRIVDVDPFIYGAADHHFVNANWLAQIIMAALYDSVGWVGLFALRLVLLGITFAALTAMLRRLGAGPAWIAWAWLAVALGAYERFTMRPELFSYALLSIQLWILNGNHRRRIAWPALLAVQILWVNLHSYFILGPIVTGCFIVAAMVTRRRRDGGEAHPTKARSQAAPLQATGRRLALLFVIQAAACLANPWHVSGAAFPFRTLSYLRHAAVMAQSPTEPVQSPWGIISEFQSPFGYFEFLGASRTTYAYAVLLGLASCGVIAAAWRRRWDWVLTILVLGAMSTQMRRNIALFAVGAAPLAVVALMSLGTRPRREPTGSSGIVRLTAQLATLVLLVWWLAGIWTGRFYFDERRPTRRLAAGWCDHVFPFRAVEWMNAEPSLKPRLFTDLMTCSNVLPWLKRDARMFITTNTFAYPAEQLMRCWNVGLGVEDSRAFLDEYDVNVVLIRAHEPTRRLIGALQRDGAWALVHFDTHFLVYLRRIRAHTEVIARQTQSRRDLEVDAWIEDAHHPHFTTSFRLGILAAVPFSLEWYDRAKPLLAEAVRLEPRYFEAWNNLGICELNFGKEALQQQRYPSAMAHFRRARACFETALQLDPDNREARFNLDNTPVRIEGVS